MVPETLSEFTEDEVIKPLHAFARQHGMKSIPFPDTKLYTTVLNQVLDGNKQTLFFLFRAYQARHQKRKPNCVNGKTQGPASRLDIRYLKKLLIDIHIPESPTDFELGKLLGWVKQEPLKIAEANDYCSVSFTEFMLIVCYIAGERTGGTLPEKVQNMILSQLAPLVGKQQKVH